MKEGGLTSLSVINKVYSKHFTYISSFNATSILQRRKQAERFKDLPKTGIQIQQSGLSALTQNMGLPFRQKKETKSTAEFSTAIKKHLLTSASAKSPGTLARKVLFKWEERILDTRKNEKQEVETARARNSLREMKETRRERKGCSGSQMVMVSRVGDTDSGCKDERKELREGRAGSPE